MFKSASVKLTMWYVLLTMGLSLIFSGVLYHFSTHELAEALESQYHALITNDYDGDNRNSVSARELDARSQHLLRNLVYFNIIVLLGSTITSYLLARRTLRPIEAAHQAQARFTAEASHELRTPLTAMRADTEATLMELSNNPKVLRRTLEGNLQDITKLEKLTNHLLEISRYRHAMQVGREDIDLEAMVREVLGQFKRLIRDKKLRVTTDTVPVTIVADRYGMQRLLTIVLDNAIKYSSPKGKITVVIIRHAKHVIVTVQDNGIGIRADDLSHVFEPFYRAKSFKQQDRDTTTVGYGLGLSLAQEIVELHHGSIDIASVAGAGVTVTIRLPART